MNYKYAIRPLFFETGVCEHEFTSHGTGTLCQYRNRLFLFTTLHSFKTDPKNLNSQYTEDPQSLRVLANNMDSNRDFLKFLSLHIPDKEFLHGRKYDEKADIVIYEVDLKDKSAKKIHDELCHLPEINLQSQNLYATGVPNGCENGIDYDNKHIRKRPLTIPVESCESTSCKIKDTHKLENIESISGMSGGAILSKNNDKLFLHGLIQSGSVESKTIHFLPAGILCDYLNTIICMD